MGNVQLVPKPDNNILHVTEHFLQDFQKHLSLVDHAVTGLAREIDILTLTCKRSLQRQDVEVSNESEQKNNLVKEKLESSVLNIINEHITENKAIMIEVARDCMNFIIQSFNGCIEVTGDDLTHLAINKYLSTANKYDSETEFQKASVDSLKREITFLMAINEKQKQEIDNLKKKEEWYIREVGKLQSRDGMHFGEKTEADDTVNYLQYRNTTNNKTGKCLTKINQSVIDNNSVPDTRKPDTVDGASSGNWGSAMNQNYRVTTNCSADALSTSPDFNTSKKTHVHVFKKEKTDIWTQTFGHTEFFQELQNAIAAKDKKHEKEIEEKQRQIDDLLSQIEIMRSKRIVRVQLYRSFTFTALNAEMELMARIRARLKLQNIKIITERCKPLTVDEEIPLLISWEVFGPYTLRTSSIVQKAIKEFEGKCATTQIAVVIFYRKSEKELMSEVQQKDDRDQGLGGIFRVVHDGTLYRSSVNDAAVDEIVDFILKTCVISKKTQV